MMLSLILNYGLSNFMNEFGVSIAGSYSLFGFVMIILLALLLFLLNMPETIILGVLSIFVVVLHAIWGGIFTVMATIVGVIYGVVLAMFVFSLFRRGD